MNGRYPFGSAKMDADERGVWMGERAGGCAAVSVMNGLTSSTRRALV